MTSSTRPSFPRRAAARSCGASCATSPRDGLSAIPQPWPTPTSSPSSSGSTRRSDVARQAPTVTVRVEVVSWVTKFVGGDGSGRRLFDERLAAGATVRSVLKGLSARFPELERALWNGDQLGEHVEVLVNDAVL